MDCLKVDPEYRSIPVSGISSDSRTILSGHIFAALKGSTVDGSNFIKNAVASGAVAVIAEKKTDILGYFGPILRSESPRRALSLLSSRFYPEQPPTIAAVTGTAGKTSVASFLRQIWHFLGYESAMIGTIGVEKAGGYIHNIDSPLTTPDPVFLHQLLTTLSREGVTHCSIEASSHGLSQRRLDGVRLTVGGFTNLGRDHMDYHLNMDDYLAAKLILFNDLLDQDQPAVIFSDDAYSHAAIDCALARKLDVRTVGRHGSFLSLKRVKQNRFSQIAEIEFDGLSYIVELPIAGEFQLTNALIAAAMAFSTGIDVDASAVFSSLEFLKSAPGRLQLIGQSSDGVPVYVDYAHKPDALQKVLEVLRPYTTGKLTLVFGCGGNRDKGKRAVMGEIAERMADRVIVTDDNPRDEDPAKIRHSIIRRAPKAIEIADRRKAIHVAVSMLRAGDCLIVVGKGHENGQIVGEITVPFSDCQVLEEALHTS